MLSTQPELPAAFELRHMDETENLRQHSVQIAAEGANEGTILWAKNQKKAEGRCGQPWDSGIDNFHCSIVVQPDFPTEQYGQLALVAIVAMGNALATHLTPMIALGYKWPNDLLIAGNKVGSVWLDASETGSTPWMCITVSVNIHTAPEDYSIPAMSVADAEGGTELTARILLETYARQFITQINSWSERGMPAMVDQWKIRAESIGEEVTIEIDENVHSGKSTGVDENGALILVTSNSNTKLISLNHAFGLYNY